jgi:hypothetical protein
VWIVCRYDGNLVVEDEITEAWLDAPNYALIAQKKMDVLSDPMTLRYTEGHDMTRRLVRNFATKMFERVRQQSNQLYAVKLANGTIRQAQAELEEFVQKRLPLDPGLQEDAEKSKRFLEQQRLQDEWTPSLKRAADAFGPVKTTFEQYQRWLAEVGSRSAEVTEVETTSAVVETKGDENQQSQVDRAASADQTNEISVGSSQQRVAFPANHVPELSSISLPSPATYQTMFTLAMKGAVQFWSNALSLPMSQPLGELAAQIYTISPKHFEAPSL